VFRAVNVLFRAALFVGGIRVVVDGRDLVPDEPRVILASNHLSIADPILLAAVVDQVVGRRTRYMFKAEALDLPILPRFLLAYGGFAVRRGQADREAYRMAREVLEAGDWLGLAPEGTRSRTGHLGEPKPGVAILAMRSGALVQPAAVWGTERLWPVGARLPRLGTTVHVRFGAPYRPGGEDGGIDRAARREALDEATDDLMRNIAALLPAPYRGRFG